MKRALKIVIISFSILVFLLIATVTAIILIIASDAKLDKSKLENKKRCVEVLDAASMPIGDTQDYVAYQDIPKPLIDAFVATEDKRFYEHHGLDYRRILGAAVSNLKSRQNKEGASTITCQLIKNTHLTQEKTFSRKIKEAKLALELEKQYDKNEIMEMYLNVIYFGSGIYGVKNAANSFFGKPLDQLGLDECASIAATTVNPSLYSPKLNADNNRKRRDLVLDLMQEQGYISSEACKEAQERQIKTVDHTTDIYETYRINAIDEASRLTGISPKMLATGYTVYTYCDMRQQQLAYDAIHLSSIHQEADRVVLYADTQGKISAYCSNFANAQSAIRRQIGSTAKPFVYAAAIEQNKLLPDTILLDEPQTFGNYKPHNYKDVYYGVLTARDALAYSANIPAVKTLSYTDMDKTYALFLSCGLPITEKDKHLGLALGGLTYGCTFDEVATAYCTLANGGIKQSCAFVDKVVDPSGNTVYRRESNGERVLGKDTAYLVTDMLEQTVKKGTAKKLGALDVAIAAKTGTVEGIGGNSDAWCAAYTPRNVCVAWSGNLSMKRNAMISVTGGGDPTTMVKKLFSQCDNCEFILPNEVEHRQIDAFAYEHDLTILSASPNLPDKYTKTILCKRHYPMEQSKTFETIPQVNCTIGVVDETIRLQLQQQALTAYEIYCDNGYYTFPLDYIEPSTKNVDKELIYPKISGWLTIKPILHGKRPIAGTEYRVFVL